jgi:hypothetical protein
MKTKKPTLQQRIINRHVSFARIWSKKDRELRNLYESTPCTSPLKEARMLEYYNARTARWICMQLARQVREEFKWQDARRHLPALHRVPVLPVKLAA